MNDLWHGAVLWWDGIPFAGLLTADAWLVIAALAVALAVSLRTGAWRRP